MSISPETDTDTLIVSGISEGRILGKDDISSNDKFVF